MAMMKIQIRTWLALVVFAVGCLSWVGGATAAEETPVEVQVDVAFGASVNRDTRALAGESTEFSAAGFTADEGRVFCLTRLENMAVPSTITHVWYHEGKTMARVELSVRGTHWRTWSSKRILPAWTGAWEVKVLDEDGMVLASGGFTVN